MSRQSPFNPDGSAESTSPSNCSYALDVRLLRVVTNRVQLESGDTLPAAVRVRLLRRQQLLMTGQLLVAGCDVCITPPEPQPGQKLALDTAIIPPESHTGPQGKPVCPNAQAITGICNQVRAIDIDP